ncbi:MAG: hypothetical protein ACPGRZ_07030 [Alphaproteobacteria bacterium]
MFRLTFLSFVFAAGFGMALLSGTESANACTGSANDPPHCINNGQAINNYADFYFSNLQNPIGCPAGAPCGAASPGGFHFGPVVTGISNPGARISGDTPVTITGINFDAAWFDLTGNEAVCNFGDCSGSRAAPVFGNGPNGGYLCGGGGGGAGCGSDAFTPRPFDFSSAQNQFSGPFSQNRTSGAIDPFGGGSENSYINPRTGETVNFDPANPPPEVEKIRELTSAYANGEIAYPFFEDWENRPISDFSLDNPNGVGGVPAERQPGFGLGSLQNATPVFAAPTPVNLTAIPAGLVNSHPYQ